MTAFILYGEDQVLAHPALAGGLRGTSAEKPLPHARPRSSDPVLAELCGPPGEDIEDLLRDGSVPGRDCRRTMASTSSRADATRWTATATAPLLVGAHFPLGAPGRAC